MLIFFDSLCDNAVCKSEFNFFDIELSGWWKLVLVILELIVSIAISVMYIKIEKYINMKFKKFVNENIELPAMLRIE